MNRANGRILKAVMTLKNWKKAASGLLIGLCNALFGAGGGLLAVPYFRKTGLSQRDAQALSLAVTLPLSALSAAVYLKNGYVTLSDALRFWPAGLCGALAGAFLLPRCSNRGLQAAFSLLLLWCGVRMLAGG